MKGSWVIAVVAGFAGVAIGLWVASVVLLGPPWAWRTAAVATVPNTVALTQPQTTLKEPVPKPADITQTRPLSAPMMPSGTAPSEKDPLVVPLQGACAEAPEKVGCYRQHLLEIVTSDGPERALDVLQQLADDDSDLVREGHPITHAIGRFAYEQYKDAPTAFARCREMFWSGCYHGVLEGFLKHTPQITAEQIATLCSGP